MIKEILAIIVALGLFVFIVSDNKDNPVSP